ncbi:MAG: LTA synthase family protein [Phycisphaerae bacterium]|nr:LTA synthase family protein [Phycisphaerae bacterium]
MRTQLSRLFKDYLFLATLAVLFVKSLLLVGFLYDPSHTYCDYRQAARDVLPRTCIYLGPLLILLSFGQLLRNRRRLWLFFAMDAATSVVLLADLWYLRGFGTLPTFAIFRHAKEAMAVRDSIASMARPVDLLFVADLVVFLAAALLGRKLYRNRERNVPAFAALLVLGLGAFFYVPAKVLVFRRADSRIGLYNVVEPNRTASVLSPVGYHLLTIRSWFTAGRPIRLTTEDTDEIRLWYEQKDEHLPDNKYKGMFKGKNLLVIQIESLERFVIGRKFEGQEITPTLNGLLKNSLFFSTIYEQVGDGLTSDAELLANTSVHPVRGVETFFVYPHATYNSLPTLLKGEGYSTHAIHPDAGTFWNWVIALTNIGFEKCTDSAAFERDEVIGLGLSDGSFLRQVAPLVRKQPQPFFVFMITLTSHNPFNLPKEHRALKLNETLDKSKMGGYFQSIHYTDKHLGIFLNALRANGLLDNTLVAIYGDHQSIHRWYRDRIEQLPITQDWWLQNDLRVPFIVYNSSIQAEEIPIIGGQVDIMPTLLYLLGVDSAKYRTTAIGRNLLNTKKSFAVIRDATAAPYRYLAEGSDEKAKEEAFKGVDVSEKIIKGGYLKNRKP